MRARLAAGAVAVATVGEEEVRVAARAHLADLDRSTPARSSRRAATARRSSIRPSATPAPSGSKRRAPRRPPRSSTARCPGPTAARVAADLLHAVLDDPGRQPAPAAVDHRRPRAAPPARPGGSRRRSTSGASPRQRRDVAVRLAGVPGRDRGSRSARRARAWLSTVAPWTCLADEDSLRVDPERGGQPLSVLPHGRGRRSRRPRLRLSNGASLTPPRRALNAARAPGRSASSHLNPISLSPVQGHAAERLGSSSFDTNPEGRPRARSPSGRDVGLAASATPGISALLAGVARS